MLVSRSGPNTATRWGASGRHGGSHSSGGSKSQTRRQQGRDVSEDPFLATSSLSAGLAIPQLMAVLLHPLRGHCP